MWRHGIKIIERTSEYCTYFYYEENKDKFNYCQTITREEHDGLKGRITLEMIKQCVENYDTANFFICGSREFSIGTRQLLKDDNIERQRIKMEVF